MTRCARCGAALAADDDRYELAGQVVCEDCYLDRMAVPKVCDPWAVYSAKKTGEGRAGLTERQKRILKLLEENGPLPLETLLKALGVEESDFRADFAVLRHLELAKATKVGDQVCYTLFR
ncbi:hypothetical protein [Desulfosoma sp.]|uniref:ArsR family transcriptional regulator n=1 Tax=Desulfacinum infernum TaxID=35837 RepID=A0A832A5N6_9BACT